MSKKTQENWMDELVHKYKLPKSDRENRKSILTEAQRKKILKDKN